VKYLADTHVVVWWLSSPTDLPDAYRRELRKAQSAGPSIGISAITLWEIAMLTDRGRLKLEIPIDEYLDRIEGSPTFEVLPLTGPIAADSRRLGGTFPRDAADQLIAATARTGGLLLMTVDEPIRRSKVVAIA
jgi:PIN domain nuclease of toxin-antitoxin system